MLALPAALSISALPAAAQTAADSAITDVELIFYLERSDSLKAKYVESGAANLVVHTFVIPRLMRGYHAAEAAFCAGALAGRDALHQPGRLARDARPGARLRRLR
jgi:hypothetical protein